MPEEKNFKSAEKTLKRSQELMDKVLRQNEKWHGAGSFLSCTGVTKSSLYFS